MTRDEAVDWAMGEEIEYFETSAVRHHISIDLCLPFFTPPHARIISLSLSLSLCLSFSNAFPRFSLVFLPKLPPGQGIDAPFNLIARRFLSSYEEKRHALAGTI